MITSSSTGAATTAALPTSSRQTEQRFSQTSTAAATPRPQCLSAPIIGAEDANTDLADFEYEVFQFRDSLEIARAHFGHAYQSTSSPSRPRERESAKRAAFPFGRNSLELAHRDLARARSHREEQQRHHPDVTPAHVFLRTLGSRFAEDRAAMLSDPVLDYELNHRDSLSLPREQRALTAAAERRQARSILPRAGPIQSVQQGVVTRARLPRSGTRGLASRGPKINKAACRGRKQQEAGGGGSPSKRDTCAPPGAWRLDLTG